MRTHLLGIRLRGGEEKPFSISNMTGDMLDIVRRCRDFQCGLSGWFSKYIIDVPDIFKNVFDYDCDKHDVGFSRGGGVIDFYENN